ncbi:TPA: 30S ribosomal protein S5 [Candidatus Woesearchaeota archaeon]|nr:30S ribosomal protein S5 [Candidatus Woesearchaeota archaeon]
MAEETQLPAEKSERPSSSEQERQSNSTEWVPRTQLGRMVKEGKITSVDQIFELGLPIMEAEIVDTLLPGLEEDLLLIGQAKGKFGGGQRRIFRQTQKKMQEGNRIQFTTCAVVGNRNGYVGIGFGKSKETVPSRDKAKRNARLQIIRIRRGCGSWETDSREANSIPFAIEGRCGSVRIKLMPAPPGKGLCVERECAKILTLAGVKDVWSKTSGQTQTKVNLIMALVDALTKLSHVKIRPEDTGKLGIVDGRVPEEAVQ